MLHEAATVTRKGDRDANQDRCAIVAGDDGILLLLADGMGGHQRGELAAQVFIDSLTQWFGRGGIRSAGALEALATAMTRAHADILTAGNREHPMVQPLTTGVACLVQWPHACWAHVGDSRLYWLRDDRVLARTRDHSMVEELISRGELEESGRQQHPWRNLVTRALGGYPEPPEITLSGMNPLLPGDVILLCSDGLWSGIAESDLFALLRAPQFEPALQQLANAAEAASQPCSDNITLAGIRLSE